MADKTIKYTTAKQQIEKLKSQNLIIKDEEYAIKQLKQCGYSNLIKSYRDVYTITYEGRKIYRSGTTFEQVQSLYLLDKNLRNAVMAAMLDLEEHIKEAAADVVADSFGVHQDDYLQFRNFRDKSKRQYRFSLAGIINTMKKTLHTDKDPIAHYWNKYGVVPPWILFKSVYFSTIINFIHQFKPAEQKKIVEHLYDVKSLKISEEALPELMMDTLFICLEYRNLVAHGGRTYNYVPTSSLRIAELIDPNENMQGFSQLLFVLSVLNYQGPFYRLSNTINKEVNRHCAQYPQDVTYLGQILNIDIIPRNVVYISNSSNKYHSRPHCSGIKNSMSLDLDEANAQGYIPCKKCFK